VARIDSLLSIVVQQGATELRLGTDREPKMFQLGTRKRLVMPQTSEETLRELLGELLTKEREEQLGAAGRIEFPYDAPGLGGFKTTLSSRAGAPGFDVVFVRSQAKAPLAPPPAAPVAVVLPSSPAVESSPRIDARAPDAVARPAAVEGSDGALAGLLARAALLRASDVHLAAGEPVTVRVDGKLHALDGEPAPPLEALIAHALSPQAHAQLGEGLSVDVALEVEGTGRFRMNVYRTSTGMAAAVRLLSRSAPALASLGLPVAIDDLAELPNGLVIACGPTGSGKSTTLAALALEVLRKRSAVLITLEDPIEYVVASPRGSGLVRQRQIGRDVRDFATGLRDALREDPDVLLIGEMRDPETIGLALTAAETGHLVLTSLHSRSASSAVERIVDAYPSERQAQVRVQLADSLRAVLAQRILPKTRGAGRVAAVELLRVTHNVSSLIREGKTAQIPSAIQSGKKEGMVALERCLADLVHAGTIAPEEARAVANEPASLAMYLGR
jgi:twitching motility protein PilT